MHGVCCQGKQICRHLTHLATAAVAASLLSCSCCCCSCSHAPAAAAACCCRCSRSTCSCCSRSAVAAASASVSRMLRLNSAHADSTQTAASHAHVLSGPFELLLCASTGATNTRADRPPSRCRQRHCRGRRLPHLEPPCCPAQGYRCRWCCPCVLRLASCAHCRRRLGCCPCCCCRLLPPLPSCASPVPSRL